RAAGGGGRRAAGSSADHPADSDGGHAARNGRTLRLAAIGSAAGMFSGLFGVGGGSVIVPLLILWIGYDAREATGTSLLVIAFVAAFAGAIQTSYGNVRPLDSLLLGAPAIIGVLLGTSLQQRVPTRAISLLFSAVLVAAAVELVLQ
ncbi:MAG: sulfite exporter TauE/SafE family protein, partial [Solirubrobacteraceae bacterium]